MTAHGHGTTEDDRGSPERKTSSDTRFDRVALKVRRGRITKQGSRLVRWAALESVQRLPRSSRLGVFREQVTARRGKGIAVVAAARRQLEYVYYALRDHHVGSLDHLDRRPQPALPAAAAS